MPELAHSDDACFRGHAPSEATRATTRVENAAQPVRFAQCNVRASAASVALHLQRRSFSASCSADPCFIFRLPLLLSAMCRSWRRKPLVREVHGNSVEAALPTKTNQHEESVHAADTNGATTVSSGLTLTNG
jgi:hypothetical protein